MKDVQKQMLQALSKADEAVDTDLCISTQARLADVMGRQRKKGRTQWWNPVMCSEEQLRELALEAAKNQNFEQMLTYSAMVLYRQGVGE